MTWYAHSGPRKNATGKFRSYSQLGTEKSAGGRYRGWSYAFVAHQTGSGVRRTRYAVSICDTNKNRVEYLRDFSSIKQATDAAQQSIDQKLGPDSSRPHLGAVPLLGDLGTIPALPTPESHSGKIVAQEK